MRQPRVPALETGRTLTYEFTDRVSFISHPTVTRVEDKTVDINCLSKMYLDFSRSDIERVVPVHLVLVSGTSTNIKL